jgi:hypothetical protein
VRGLLSFAAPGLRRNAWPARSPDTHHEVLTVPPTPTLSRKGGGK